MSYPTRNITAFQKGWSRAWDVLSQANNGIDKQWVYMDTGYCIASVTLWAHRFVHPAHLTPSTTMVHRTWVSYGINGETNLFVEALSPDWDPLLPDTASSTTLPESTPAVNDYTCTACKNDRCSKGEKSCWRCGSPILATMDQTVGLRETAPTMSTSLVDHVPIIYAGEKTREGEYTVHVVEASYPHYAKVRCKKGPIRASFFTTNRLDAPPVSRSCCACAVLCDIRYGTKHFRCKVPTSR